LSHSNGHIACILHQNHIVGIDVQVENAKLKRIATKFLNDDEMQRYEDSDKSLPYLHLLWSAKEAVFKIHRHHMAFKKICTDDFDLMEKGRIKIKAERFDGLHKHEVHFKRLDDVYLAYSCYDPDK
jgi:4'-phosphopantetheinyl transferase EntD